jgi:hypothetical protein
LAFEDRTLILKFPNSFVGKNQVDNIERTWLEDAVEVSGIFNWMLEGLHRLGVNGDFTLSRTTQEVILEFKRSSDPIGAWMEDKCIFDVDGFVFRKAAFEDYKNYCDQELGKAPETERRFYQRLRDTPKIKDYESSKGRGFKGIRLKNPDEKPEGQKQTQLTDAPDTAITTDNSMSKKNLSSTKEENNAAEKVVVPVVAAATEKKSTDKDTPGQKLGENELQKDTKEPKVEVCEITKTALINNDPIHYHVLAPNEPHPCDKYGCSREAKYHFGNSYYCDDKAVSHFREIANKCHQEGFMLIEDLVQLDV